ncbi:2-C-methyl-D-erythritol 2,4-cyclodiphosphate synthase [Roseicitreum antarcticum]|uniref:2-C-methyl-D-erythritol 2,4-cyclodiphosphate synthase n=1 Tax=Roseicitreum antarcticum TaxID=564137 RepID=A0A1H3C4L1_9RHOB|nr:2-C-methyl-D-erythritol 2,4-cyclodiphosphate synthase [Roseicitreum antarcticum]SDX49041.1 2-C-methyl-D-erythritol 2,4-cyclodiphosphate synthase [Roseicitreum antarcticum]
MDIRTGNGFDVHRFGPGDGCWLCGVKVAHDRGLMGHSDADVGMHALTDAIYGALCEGDIGQHFPPSDPQWKGAESRIFLAHAMSRVAARGFTLTHADVTLICEFPKIGPHTVAMRQALAAITGVDAGRISVKATTSERLGFTGRGEGIAAMATATLVQTAPMQPVPIPPTPVAPTPPKPVQA